MSTTPANGTFISEEMFLQHLKPCKGGITMQTRFYELSYPARSDVLGEMLRAHKAKLDKDKFNTLVNGRLTVGDVYKVVCTYIE